jgi:hypothetical protein
MSVAGASGARLKLSDLTLLGVKPLLHRGNRLNQLFGVCRSGAHLGVDETPDGREVLSDSRCFIR